MNRPLSVGIVTPTVSRAGGGIFPIVLAHARELATYGHQVVVHGLDCDPKGIDRSLWEGVALSLHRPGPFGYAPRLLDDLLAADHDILHQHGLWLYPSVAVSRWRARTERSTVISVQGMLEPWALTNSAWKKRIAAIVFESGNLRNAGAIHCSAGERGGVHRSVPGAPIAVIPNGTDLPSLAALRKARVSSANGKKTLLFMGRLHPKKGIAELIEAYSLLQRTEPTLSSRWHLVIAGWDDGGYAQGFQELARNLGLDSDDVTFPGPRFGKDKSALLASADAFVLPSYSEGFPMAVLEAWAHGLPVLMTQECNIPEGFAAGAAIQIGCRPRTLVAELARALARDDLPAIGSAGRALVESRFAWPSVVADLTQVYGWLVRGDQKPDFVNCPPGTEQS